MPRRKPYEVLIPPVVQVEVDKLAGQRAGLQVTVKQLALDPCALGAPVNLDSPKAYRLSGPLQPVVCGTHLRHGYRLAYTMREAVDAPGGIQVVILYVGKKDDPAYERGNDIWDFVHDLFGVTNPPVGHLKPPCCEKNWPAIDDDTLAEFITRLRSVQRG